MTARMINKTAIGKNSQYRLFWIGNKTGNSGVGIFVSKKWIQKVLEVKPFSNRLMMIQLQMNKRTVVVYSFSLCTSTRPL